MARTRGMHPGMLVYNNYIKSKTHILLSTSIYHKFFTNNQYITKVPLEGGRLGAGHLGAIHLPFQFPACVNEANSLRENVIKDVLTKR
jgi:hypothetical protein